MLAWSIGLANAVCCLIVLFLPVHIGLKWVGTIMLVMAAVYFIRRYATLTLPRSVNRLSLTHESKLQLTFRNGATQEAEVLESSFVAAYLTVVNTKDVETGRRISVILMPDNTARPFQAITRLAQMGQGTCSGG
jgi:toxin CptA